MVRGKSTIEIRSCSSQPCAFKILGARTGVYCRSCHIVRRRSLSQDGVSGPSRSFANLSSLRRLKPEGCAVRPAPNVRLLAPPTCRPPASRGIDIDDPGGFGSGMELEALEHCARDFDFRFRFRFRSHSAGVQLCQHSYRESDSSGRPWSIALEISTCMRLVCSPGRASRGARARAPQSSELYQTVYIYIYIYIHTYRERER